MKQMLVQRKRSNGTFVISDRTNVTHKICCVCKNTKPLNDFHKDKSQASGRCAKCKQCKVSYESARQKKLRKTSVHHRIKHSLSNRIRLALVSGQKSTNTMALVGCNIEEFKKYLESMFVDGMDWGNYGLWHIDHIIPCISFDLSNEQEQRKCFHYTNMQPLWAKDNLIKSSKIIAGK